MIEYVGTNTQSRRGLSNLLHIDLKLFLAIIAVTLLGLLTIYSSSSGDMSLVIKQFTRIVIGIVTMIFIAQVHPDNLRLFAPPLYFFTLLLLILVLFFGVGNTADRWLDLYFIRFQPSELMKIFVPLMVAYYYSDKPLPPSFKYILVASIVVLTPVLMIMKQPDLGTALLIAMSGAIAILLAGISIKFFVTSLIIIISLVCSLDEYACLPKTTYFNFFNPESDPMGSVITYCNPRLHWVREDFLVKVFSMELNLNLGSFQSILRFYL